MSTNADSDQEHGGEGILNASAAANGAKNFAFAAVNVLAGATGTPVRSLPSLFIDDNPVKVWVTQDGLFNGSDPGASQGAAIVYLVIVTPADG